MTNFVHSPKESALEAWGPIEPGDEMALLAFMNSWYHEEVQLLKRSSTPHPSMQFPGGPPPKDQRAQKE